MPAAPRFSWLLGLASAVVPGLGQFLSGRRARGLALLGLLAGLIGLVVWAVTPQLPALSAIPLKGDPRYGWWLMVPGLLWLWNIWDAAAPAAQRYLWVPSAAAGLMLLVIGAQATQIDLAQLTQHGDRMLLILRPMLRPDFVQTHSEKLEGWVNIEVPCGPNPPAGQDAQGSLALQLSVGCAAVGDVVTVTGSGFWPDTQAHLIWQSPIGDFLPLRTAEAPEGEAVMADATGSFTTEFTVPNAIPPGIDPNFPQGQRLYIRQERAVGGWELSTNGGFVLLGIYQTITLALMATTFGALLAIPISFLAARNLMSANPLTLALYVLVRTLLNIVRSIESLIIAIVFVVIVGLGPFAGMLALTVHTIAALAKLYSEVIEGIDPGPIEAMQAAGANWLQVVRYGVVPQIVPPFTAFTIYRWDINVRASTIIGFVGGGGIGFFLVQWINLGDFRAVSATFLAILVVVMIMDFVSARVRARLV